MTRPLRFLLFVVPLFAVLGCTSPAGQAICQGVTTAAVVAVSAASDKAGDVLQSALSGVCSGPGSSPMGVMGPTNQCAPVDGEDACQTCTRSMCCELAANCGADRACWGNIACASLEALGEGPTSSCITTYDVPAPDSSYTATLWCMKENCGHECENLLEAAGQ